MSDLSAAWLDESTAIAYLRSRGMVSADEPATARRLAGGVSNEVWYIDRPAESFVLKQARPQLRTQDPWFSPVERIWRETDVLKACGEALRATADLAPQGLAAIVPDVLFEDRDRYCYAMTAAPPEHRTWKTDLLAGTFDAAAAVAAGNLLGRLHVDSLRRTDVQAELVDRTFFRQLRIEPYFEFAALSHPDLAERFAELGRMALGPATGLVHADYSPKNLLVWDGGMMLVDFETGHRGDPAFDLGFFLTHLLLKCVYFAPHDDRVKACLTEFLAAYEATYAAAGVPLPAELLERTTEYLAGCLLARVDGKSKIDYLPQAPSRDRVRRLARRLWSTPAPCVASHLAEVLHAEP